MRVKLGQVSEELIGVMTDAMKGYSEVSEEGIAGWPDIIPISSQVLPEFPVTTLPGWLLKFVEELSTATQTPKDLSSMICIAVLAVALAKKIEVVPHEGWIEPLNIYVVVALPPGNRKSAVFGECIHVLNEYENELKNKNRAAIKAAQIEIKALEQAMQLAQSKRAKVLAEGKEPNSSVVEELSKKMEAVTLPILPKIIADDSTVEAIAGLLAEQSGKIAIMSPEGDLFDILGGRYSANSSVNLGAVLKGHCGDDISVDRIGRSSIYVKRPAITIGVAVQPDVLNGLVQRPGFRGRGLLGRFLYSLPESVVGRRSINPQPLSECVKQTYFSKISELLQLDMPNEPYKLKLSSEAESLFLVFEEALEPRLGEEGDLGMVVDWASKLSGAIARIAGLLHMAKYAGQNSPWCIPIEVDTVKNAIEIGKYAIEHAKASFNLMGANKDVEDAKKFLRWIKKKGNNEFSQRELFQSMKGSFKKVNELNAGLKVLQEFGYIRQVEVLRAIGRPSIKFEVNPRTFDMSSKFS
ncbi:YfjI family protein [Anaeroarcus burkinensis]|uniref:YfjI family protein n=1 Tax=Anaeroarcus burkinensis TaxID=82376 RepID=UPI000400993B|nr:YfjI family protein [Anaeroarcus burkinensis]